MTPPLSFDLVVVGGGLAGCAAAISAARRGLSVLLAEREAALGGAPVGNLVMPFMPWRTRDPATGGTLDLSQGLFTELCDRLRAMGGMEPDTDCCVPFSEPFLRVLLDRLCAEAGVKVLFHAALADVAKDGDRIAAREGEGRLIAFVNGVIDEVLASGAYMEWYEEAAARANALGL